MFEKLIILLVRDNC